MGAFLEDQTVLIRQTYHNEIYLNLPIPAQNRNIYFNRIRKSSVHDVLCIVGDQTEHAVHQKRRRIVGISTERVQ